jgi:MFS family permease
MAATIAVYMFTVGATALFWGPFCDRWGRRNTLLLSCTAFTGFCVGCTFSHRIDSERPACGCRRQCRGGWQ